MIDLEKLLEDLDEPLGPPLILTADTVKALVLALIEARQVLDFFAEPSTWANEHEPLGTGLLNNTYGSMAREKLKKLDEILGGV
jgi:hypothetical protein